MLAELLGIAATISEPITRTEPYSRPKEMQFTFTDEEISALAAEAERMMDSGQLQYVVCGGFRLPVFPEIMTKFGLETGQMVSAALVLAITEATLPQIKQER